ncbi:MAG: hypothetical protein PHQ34_05570 [Methanothrix sp.]|nr:hypothetical protein [Methanothrix sp.]
MFKEDIKTFNEKIDQFSEKKHLCGYDERPIDIERLFKNKIVFLKELISILNESNKIDIMGRDLLDIYGLIEFPPFVIDSTSKGKKFRFLILDPDSLACKSLNISYSDYINDWLDYYRDPNNRVNAKFIENFEIRVYNKLPISFLMIVDTYLIYSPYWENRRTIDNPYLKIVQSERVAFESCRSHFETVWSSAVPIQEFVKKYGTK